MTNEQKKPRAISFDVVHASDWIESMIQIMEDYYNWVSEESSETEGTDWMKFILMSPNQKNFIELDHDWKHIDTEEILSDMGEFENLGFKFKLTSKPNPQDGWAVIVYLP